MEVIRLVIAFIIIHSCSGATCPKHWISPPGDTSCYKFIQVLSTWNESSDYCQSLGGHLLVINSEKEREWIFSSIREHTLVYTWWIGLIRGSNGSWLWIDGTELDNTILQWDNGEPENVTLSEDCAEYNTYVIGAIDDNDCRSGFPFICESELAHGESSCQTFWLKRRHSQSCYLVDLQQWNTWFGSLKFCQENGGYLAIINSVEEKEWLKEVMEHYGATRIWIGLTKRNEEGAWKWNDGTNMDTNITPWRTGQPRGRRGNTDYVLLASEGHMLSVAYFFQMTSICEISGEPYKTACATPQVSDTQYVRCYKPDGTQVQCLDVLHVINTIAWYECKESYQSTTGLPKAYSICQDNQEWSAISAFQCIPSDE